MEAEKQREEARKTEETGYSERDEREEYEDEDSDNDGDKNQDRVNSQKK